MTQHVKIDLSPSQTEAERTPSAPKPVRQSKQKRRVGRARSNRLLLFVLILTVGTVATLVAGLLYLVNLESVGSLATNPQNYAECVAAPGSVILESYPMQCRSKDGQTFVQPVDNFDPLGQDEDTGASEDDDGSELENGADEEADNGSDTTNEEDLQSTLESSDAQ